MADNEVRINGIDDSGKRMSYGEGKAMREPSDGKGRYDLITPFGLRRVAKWYELGAKKYADRNWEKGIPFSRCIDSAKRHIDKYIMGMTDEDHLAAAVWNLLAIIHYEELGMTELDDMLHYLKNREADGLKCPNCGYMREYTSKLHLVYWRCPDCGALLRLKGYDYVIEELKEENPNDQN